MWQVPIDGVAYIAQNYPTAVVAGATLGAAYTYVRHSLQEPDMGGENIVTPPNKRLRGEGDTLLAITAGGDATPAQAQREMAAAATQTSSTSMGTGQRGRANIIGSGLSVIGNPSGFQPARKVVDRKYRKATDRRKYTKGPINLLRDLKLALAPLLKWHRHSYLPNLGSISTNIGRQLVFDAGASTEGYTIAAREDLKDIVVKYDYDCKASALTGGLVNVYQNATQLAPACFQSWIRQYTFSNTTSHAVYLELWELIKRRGQDSARDPLTDWAQDYHSLATTTGDGVYGLRATRNTQAPLYAIGMEHERTYNDPGARPDKSCKNFHRAWAVTRKAAYVVPPGKTVIHVTNLKGFYINDTELQDTEDDSDTGIPGITTYIMGFMQGERCYDNTPGAQQLSYTAPVLTVRIDETIQVRRPPRFRRFFEFHTHVNAASTGTLVTSQPVFPVAALPTTLIKQEDVPHEQSNTQMET